jgi:hypothetical protein
MYDFIPDLGHSSTTSLGVAIGPCYSLPLGPRVWAFLNLKAGFSWSKTGEGIEDDEFNTWSRTQTLFPVIQTGFKFFFVRSAAAVVQLQYDRLSESKQRTTTFGIGLAVYL